MNITITGNLGSGKSSVAKILKEKGYEIISTGNIFRQLAMEKGLSVEEFNKQVNEAASRGDRSVDKMIDDTTTKIGMERDHIVFDSRLAWNFAPKSFKVFVITDIDEASRRVFNDSQRADSESYESLEACKKALINRQMLETVRYKEIYNIDYYDMSNYNLVIESTNALPNEIAQEILDRLEDYSNHKFTKLMELNPSSIKKGDAGDGSVVQVSELDGVFALTGGKTIFETALSNGDRFVPVRVASSKQTCKESFMNFSNLINE
jgi:cytidylate kinase